MLEITSLYAALSALILLVLALRVVQQRWATRTGIGDGGDKVLARRIRIHANAMENIPIVLILLGLAEMGGAAAWLLHACGAALVIGRLTHAYGMTRTAGSSWGRATGMLTAWLATLVLSIQLLLSALPHLQ